MTKKIYYIFTLIGSLLLSSCDSYLDIQPVGQVIPNTLAEYRALFTTAYNTALNDRGICEIRTDIATILQSDATSKNSLGDVEKWNDVNPNASTRQFGWAAYYTNIYYANAIIDKKDEISEGSQEDINQLVGEAYLMRAYMHFILVNLYGQPYTATGALETKAVPLKLNTDLEEIPSRNTVKEIYYIFTLIGSLLLSSCDSYLDIQPVGQVIPNTLAEYRALFTTAYNTALNDRGICEIRTDIATILQSDATSKNSLGDVEKWNDVNPNASTRQFGWAAYYTNIYYANAIIDKKDEISEGSQEDINQLVGEAYLMRAYMHFILVNLYGQPYTAAGALETKAVPLKLNTDLEEIPSRNTVKEIYTSILSDIETARKLINKKEWEVQYSYRFSTLSVDAMESRVYLYMGEWDKSYESSERVLAGKSTLVNLNDEGDKLPNEFTSVEMITAYEVFPNSDYAGSLLLYPSFLQEYEEGKDLRPNKYYQANKNGNYTSIKSGESKFKCTFRTGELYLNSAEAAAHLNKLPEARTRLLKLIENRYTSEGYEQKKNEINAMSQEKLVTEILKERARELAFEGHRWFDLRRTTRPEIKKEIEDVTYTLVQDDSRYTLRIPQDAIDANPGLLN